MSVWVEDDLHGQWVRGIVVSNLYPPAGAASSEAASRFGGEWTVNVVFASASEYGLFVLNLPTSRVYPRADGVDRAEFFPTPPTSMSSPYYSPSPSPPVSSTPRMLTDAELDMLDEWRVQLSLPPVRSWRPTSPELDALRDWLRSEPSPPTSPPSPPNLSLLTAQVMQRDEIIEHSPEQGLLSWAASCLQPVASSCSLAGVLRSWSPFSSTATGTQRLEAGARCGGADLLSYFQTPPPSPSAASSSADAGPSHSTTPVAIQVLSSDTVVHWVAEATPFECYLVGPPSWRVRSGRSAILNLSLVSRDICHAVLLLAAEKVAEHREAQLLVSCMPRCYLIFRNQRSFDAIGNTDNFVDAMDRRYRDIRARAQRGEALHISHAGRYLRNDVSGHHPRLSEDGPRTVFHGGGNGTDGTEIDLRFSHPQTMANVLEFERIVLQGPGERLPMRLVRGSRQPAGYRLPWEQAPTPSIPPFLLPPSAPPSPSAHEVERFDGHGRRAFSLGSLPRHREWLSALTATPFLTWLREQAEPTGRDGVAERTWVYPGYEHLFPPSRVTLLRPLALHEAALRSQPPGFPSTAALFELFTQFGEFALTRVLGGRRACLAYRLMAVQVSCVAADAERGPHNDMRTQGRIIITLTIDGSGVVTLQGLESGSADVPILQEVGDFYAIWGPYVLPLLPPDPSYSPKHSVVAGSCGRVSLTFRFESAPIGSPSTSASSVCNR